MRKLRHQGVTVRKCWNWYSNLGRLALELCEAARKVEGRDDLAPTAMVHRAVLCSGHCGDHSGPSPGPGTQFSAAWSVALMESAQLFPGSARSLWEPPPQSSPSQ